METYENHPNNYLHNINMTNIHENLQKSNYDDFWNSRNSNKQVLKEFNDKYNKKVSGFEKILNFKNMQIGNEGLVSLRKINFENLEIFNLENNNINFNSVDIKNILNKYNSRIKK